MTAKDELLQELETAPDTLIQQLLTYWHQLKRHHRSADRNGLSPHAFVALEQLVKIGRRQPINDAEHLSNLSRRDLERRNLF